MTPLAGEHKNLGAKMVDFSGWLMPVQYTNVIDEHITTRNKAGLFDICHMGEFVVKGKDSFDLIQKLIVGELNKIRIGEAMYSLMCYENATVVDDLFIYKLDENEYMLVVNASNIEKDFEWINKYSTGFDVKIGNISEKTGKIDLQGPLSEKILGKLLNVDLPKRFEFIKTSVDNHKIIISRTGYTGDDGFEFYTRIDTIKNLWIKLMEAGQEFGIKAIGLGARDTLRIEACYSLYGHEINDAISPIEAGLGWAVKNKKEDYIGKNILEMQKKIRTKRKSICFSMLDRAIARENYDIISNEKIIGMVTSGTYSPTFKKSLGMALIEANYAKIGNELNIKIRDKLHKAEIVKRPFYAYKGGK